MLCSDVIDVIFGALWHFTHYQAVPACVCVHESMCFWYAVFVRLRDVDMGGGERYIRSHLGGDFCVKILKNWGRNGPKWSIRTPPEGKNPHPPRPWRGSYLRAWSGYSQQMSYFQCIETFECVSLSSPLEVTQSVFIDGDRVSMQTHGI